MGKVIYWTDEEIQYLQDNYYTKSAEEIGKHIGKNKRAVFLKANRLGITKKVDVETLKKLAFKLSDEQLAKKFNRTPQAIRGIKRRQDIGGMLSGNDKMTFREVSRIVHKADSTIGRTWRKRGLKYQQFGSFCMVTEKDLIDFCRDNQDLWNACDCEQYFFNNCKWFEEKRKADFNKMIEKKWGTT